MSKKLARAAVVAAVVCAPVAFAQAASADPINGGCSGGVIAFNTDSSLGLMQSPVSGRMQGNFDNCVGTPAGTAVFRGDFRGDNASCLAVPAWVHGTVDWANGESSEFDGPFFVPGGLTGAPYTSKVKIVAGPGVGGTLAVDQGPLNGIALIGPCLAGQTHQGQIPINGLRFN